MKIVIVLFFAFCFVPKVCAQDAMIEDGWKNIRPFVTNREQVEKTLGKPQPSTDKIYTVYPTPEGHVAVVYAGDPCAAAPGEKGDFNLAKNTVLSYIVSLATPFPFSELKWKKDRYEQAEDPHHLNVIDYYSRRDGVSITTGIIDGTRVVSGFRFEASPEQRRSFRCNGAPVIKENEFYLSFPRNKVFGN